MILSFALLILFGMLTAIAFRAIRLPSFLGMLLVGIIMGPYMLNLIDDSILSISADLRTIALIIILLRAGLALDISTIKQIGRPAILLSFVPALLEMAMIVLIAPLLFSITYLEALVLAAVIAAVSPAVLIPGMLRLIERKRGVNKKIPHLLLAGASLDDIFVILVFTVAISFYFHDGEVMTNIINVPIAIGFGFVIGGVMGFALALMFKKIHIRDSIKVILIIGVATLFVGAEPYLPLAFSGLFATLVLGIFILYFRENVAHRLANKFDKVWVFSELLLFVLVGAAVNIHVMTHLSMTVIILLLFALFARSIGVYIATINTNLNTKERVFCAISYLPKATVQAAIGSIPLAMGMAQGELILAVAVIAIIFTAPLGAIGIEMTQTSLLEQNE